MKKGFSLVELMVVIIILGLLAALVLPNLTGKADEAKRNLTCVQMNSTAQILKMYSIDNGAYPTTEEKLDILVEKKYLDKGKLPKDGWSNPFIYISNEEDKTFELISLGGDSKEGGEDDIYYSKCSK